MLQNDPQILIDREGIFITRQGNQLVARTRLLDATMTPHATYLELHLQMAMEQIEYRKFLTLDEEEIIPPPLVKMEAESLYLECRHRLLTHIPPGGAWLIEKRTDCELTISHLSKTGDITDRKMVRGEYWRDNGCQVPAKKEE